VHREGKRPDRLLVVALLTAALALVGSGFAQTKITFWTWVGLEPAVEQFEAEHPDIDVELVTFGPWDLHDKLLTALAAGTGAPDVAQLVIRRFDAYRDTGQLVDLAPYLDEAYLSEVPASIWPAVSSGDGIYGVPTDYGPGVIWYRRDVFEQYGIGWAMWDYAGGFSVVNTEDGRRVPDEGTLKALGLQN